jgi:hypothetical protein
VKGVNQSIRRDLPAFGDTGLRRAGLVKGDESLEERVSDAAFRLTGDQRRIDRLRLGSIEEDEVGAVHRTLAADEEGKRGGESAESGDESKHEGRNLHESGAGSKGLLRLAWAGALTRRLGDSK